MSVEEMAKEYSKKWGVPEETAKKQIQKFLAKKPEEQKNVTPDADNIFPDPLGPVSKKFQDLNQAILSTAFTRNQLRELSQPPEEMKTLKDKIEFFEKNLDGMMTLVNTTMKDMQTTLEQKKKEEEKKELLAEVTEIIQPLKNQLDTLAKVKEGEPGAMKDLTPEKILEVGKDMTKKAEDLLRARGYKVELPKGLTMEEVNAKIEESLKLKKQEWEEKAGAEVAIETERIRATEKMLSDVTDRIFKIFLDPLKDEIHKAIKSRAFARQPPA